MLEASNGIDTLPQLHANGKVSKSSASGSRCTQLILQEQAQVGPSRPLAAVHW